MATLSQNLAIPRCPHCSVANPNLYKQWNVDTNDYAGTSPRKWIVYVCGRCGGLVSAWAKDYNEEVMEYFPVTEAIKDDIPERPRAYLQQALESQHAPAGALMLAASAVDAMLRLKNYTEGSLYARIEKAAADHLITEDMIKWARAVSLDANDPRGADAAALPGSEDASRAIDFATALAEFLFVLPSRVQKGIRQSRKSS
jgi:hypothetical protein